MSRPLIELGLVSRLRVWAGRPLVRLVLGSTAARSWLARSHRAMIPEIEEHTAAMLRLDEIVNGRPSSRLERQRLDMRESIAMAEDVPPGAIVVRDRAFEAPGSRHTIRIRDYAPESLDRDGPAPALVFFHGGGFVLGDLDTHDPVCRRLAITGNIRVLAVDYRLAPEHPFPSPLDDCLAAYEFIAQSAAEFGIDPTRIAVGGDSAGGNLSAVVALKMRGRPIAPALQVLMYPTVDATRSHASHRTFAKRLYLTEAAIAWFLVQYVGRDEAQQRHPDISPLFAADLSGAAPALVVTAALDPLRDEGEAYAARLAQAGVPMSLRRVPGLIHGFTLMTGLVPSARLETERLGRAIGRSLSSGAPDFDE